MDIKDYAEDPWISKMPLIHFSRKSTGGGVWGLVVWYWYAKRDMLKWNQKVLRVVVSAETEMTIECPR